MRKMNRTINQRMDPCPICGETSFFSNPRKVKPKFIKCPICNNYSIDPMISFDISNSATEWMTNNIYLNEQKLEQHFNAKFLEVAYGRILRKIQIYRKKGNLLDIGCGVGGFLGAAKKDGWIEYGVDSGSSSLIGKAMGLNIVQNDFLELDFRQDFFDVITMIDVFEHISNPKHLLEKITTILRPGGLVLIITPNINGFSSRILKENWLAYQQIDHYILYSPGSIRSLFLDSNLIIQKIETNDLFVSELIMKYKTNKLDNKFRIEEQLRKRALITVIMKYKLISNMRNLMNYFINLTQLGDRIILWITKPE